MEISSSTLSHHKKEFKYFIKILEEGFEHRVMNESLPFTPNSNSAFFGPGIIRYDFTFQAVCFTDLPIDKIESHINQYGKYIISLSKNWGIANGITPIRYVHHYTPDLLNDKLDLIRSFVENPNMSSSIIKTVNEFLSKIGIQETITSNEISNLPDKYKYLIKFYDHLVNDISLYTYSHFGLMREYEGEWEDRVTGDKKNRRFYDEREWRSLDIDGKKGNLTFTAESITNIFIPTNKEKQEVIDLFKENMEKFQIKDFDKFVNKIKLTSELIS